MLARLRAFLRWVTTAEARPPCPKCHDDRLVAWDAVLQRWVCDVCSHQWRRPLARRAA